MVLVSLVCGLGVIIMVIVSLKVCDMFGFIICKDLGVVDNV